MRGGMTDCGAVRLYCLPRVIWRACRVPGVGVVGVIYVLHRIVFCLVVMVGIPESKGEKWPSWRGPTGDGVVGGSAYATEWSAERNIRWKVPLPEPGNSTPIVWGDRIFLTQAVGNQRQVHCLDLGTGRKLWAQGVTFDGSDPTHRQNPHCSASAVTDGERVVAWFGSAGLWACDMQGTQLWHRQLGKQTHEWGVGISPLIHNGLCIIQCGAGDREFLTAFDLTRGDVVWQVDTPRADKDPIGEVGPEDLSESSRSGVQKLRGAWATPRIVRFRGDDQLIVCSPLRVSAYDPGSGALVWTCRGLGPLVYAGPIVHSDRVVALGGYHSASVAVRLGGSGDVTESHRLWREPRGRSWLGSGIAYDGHMYLQDMQGILHCFGQGGLKPVGRKRLAGSEGNNASWSSLSRAGDKLYVVNQSADVFVVNANPSLELLAKNSLRERTNSSLAFAGGNILLRTHDHLWCIGETP